MKLRFKAKKFICLIYTAALLITLVPTQVRAEEYWPEGPSIETPSAIVMEVNSGAVLYEKNSDEKNYPASITKILTTLLALENCEMNEIVTFSKDAIKNTPRDSTHIARDVGEEMTMEECLYAVLLMSANECAYAVAEHVGKKLGGDYQTFIDLMNERAAEIGCENTHFNNSSGLPDKEHWTSARDMALISAEAYKNETFRIITGTKKYQVPPTNKHSEVTYLVNHHKMLHYYQTGKYVYEYCTGGKTGYTDAAGSTLVTYAEKDGLTLVSVVMRTNSKAEWLDSTELLDYCFENFKPFTIAENETSLMDEDANKGVLNNHDAYVSLDSNAYIVLPAMASFSDAVGSMAEAENSGNVIARMSYTYAGRPVGSVNIVASGSKVEESYFQYAKEREEEQGKKVVKIKPIWIILVLTGIVVTVALIIIAKRVYDNYYVMLHNREVKRQRKARFRPVSSKKRHWKRRDRMFR